VLLAIGLYSRQHEFLSVSLFDIVVHVIAGIMCCTTSLILIIIGIENNFNTILKNCMRECDILKRWHSLCQRILQPSRFCQGISLLCSIFAHHTVLRTINLGSAGLAICDPKYTTIDNHICQMLVPLALTEGFMGRNQGHLPKA
jgi:hypothetical protein